MQQHIFQQLRKGSCAWMSTQYWCRQDSSWIFKKTVSSYMYSDSFQITCIQTASVYMHTDSFKLPVCRLFYIIIMYTDCYKFYVCRLFWITCIQIFVKWKLEWFVLGFAQSEPALAGINGTRGNIVFTWTQFEASTLGT